MANREILMRVASLGTGASESTTMLSAAEIEHNEGEWSTLCFYFPAVEAQQYYIGQRLRVSIAVEE